MKFANAVLSIYRSVIGRKICPLCQKQGLTVQTSNPIHEEGPPLFVRWYCVLCKAVTPWEDSPLVKKVASELGQQGLIERFSKVEITDEGDQDIDTGLESFTSDNNA